MPEESARWFSDLCDLVEIYISAKMMGSQEDYLERGWGGGLEEKGNKG